MHTTIALRKQKGQTLFRVVTQRPSRRTDTTGSRRVRVNALELKHPQLVALAPRSTSRPRASARTSPRMQPGPSSASPPALRHTLVRRPVGATSPWSRILATAGTLCTALRNITPGTTGMVCSLYRCSPLAGRGPGGLYGVVAGSVFSAYGLAVRLAVRGGAFKPVIYA